MCRYYEVIMAFPNCKLRSRSSMSFAFSIFSLNPVKVHERRIKNIELCEFSLSEVMPCNSLRPGFGEDSVTKTFNTTEWEGCLICDKMIRAMEAAQESASVEIKYYPYKSTGTPGAITSSTETAPGAVGDAGPAEEGSRRKKDGKKDGKTKHKERKRGRKN